MNAKEIFDTAVCLSPGEKLVVSFNTKQQRESMRVMLSRERLKFKQANNKEDIIYTRTETEGN